MPTVAWERPNILLAPRVNGPGRASPDPNTVDYYQRQQFFFLIVSSTSMIRLFCAIYFDPDRQIWVQGTVDWNQQEPGSTHEFFLGCLCYGSGQTSPDSNTVGSSQHQLFKD